MIRRLTLVLLLLVASVDASFASGESPKIVHGTNEPGYPAVGWLQTATGYCTATLIGCQTVLTAAHCVCTGQNGVELPPAQCASAGLLNPAGKAVFFHHAGIFTVSAVAVHPQRNPGDDFTNPLHDLAVLTLSSPVTGIAPAVINQAGAVTNGAAGTIVGFGVTHGFALDLGIKRSGPVSTEACDIPGHLCWTYDGTGSNTCGGDSGGPLFVNTAQGPRLAGVTSFGLRESCQATDSSYDADVYPDRAWIASAAGADLATGARQCGAVPNAGEANTSIVGRVDPVATEVTSSAVVVPAGTAELRVGTSGTGSVQLTLNGPTGATFCGSASAVAFCRLANPAPGGYTVTVRNLSSGTREIQTVFTLLGVGAAAGDPEPPAGPWLTTSQLPGYRFKVRINGAAAGTQVADCVPETLCVAGAIPTRTELFLRVIGPRPNGFLWTQGVRFTTSRLEVWVERTATAEVRYYDLPAVAADSDTLPGLVDKTAFAP